MEGAPGSSALRRVRRLQTHLGVRESESESVGRDGPGMDGPGMGGCKAKKKRRRFTKDDVESARDDGLIWLVVHGKVYDVTDFLEEHPGGAEIVTDIEWDDFETMDAEFDDAEHSEEAMEDLEELYIGRFEHDDDDDAGGDVEDEDNDDDDDDEEDDDEEDDEDESDDDESEEEESEEEESEEEEALDPMRPFSKFQELELALIDTISLSHDVSVFRFALPSAEHELGLPVGQHIILAFEAYDGQTISRPYTPCSPRGERGFIDFLIKLYPTGKMSNHLQGLAIGQQIRMRGPKGKLEYFGGGEFLVRKKRRRLRHIGMICGGSGITPMFQILQAVASDAEDGLKISLLFANKTEADIILRDAIEAVAASRPGSIDVHFTLDVPPAPEGGAEWPHFTGFVSQDMIAAVMPPPAPDAMVLLCGPPPMIKKACIPNLQALGYTRDDYFKF